MLILLNFIQGDDKPCGKCKEGERCDYENQIVHEVPHTFNIELPPPQRALLEPIRLDQRIEQIDEQPRGKKTCQHNGNGIHHSTIDKAGSDRGKSLMPYIITAISCFLHRNNAVRSV
jgi:hypothetical protein